MSQFEFVTPERHLALVMSNLGIEASVTSDPRGGVTVQFDHEAGQRLTEALGLVAEQLIAHWRHDSEETLVDALARAAADHHARQPRSEVASHANPPPPTPHHPVTTTPTQPDQRHPAR